MSDKAYLVLENGRIFEGEFFGYKGETLGEIVFTTGMTGYLETITDKSYYGQIIVQTFPLIGNYGVIASDFESNETYGNLIHAKAYIVKSWCREPSNFRNEGTLDTFLKARKVVGICGIDTRALTGIIRENGVLNGMITSDPANVNLDDIKAYRISSAVSGVSTKSVYHEKNDNVPKYKVAVLDLGIKESIKNELVKRDCEVWVFPHNSSASDIAGIKPDGIMLSNGPGDPLNNLDIVENLKELMSFNIPILGICLGHQLLALANGFKTEKLKFGHRGGNQPVQDVNTGTVYITSQNHGYAVVNESINEKIAKPLFVNVNDKTNEGIEYLNVPAFSAQFHPEASSDPLDTGFLFDRFLNLMNQGGKSHA